MEPGEPTVAVLIEHIFLGAGKDNCSFDKQKPSNFCGLGTLYRHHGFWPHNSIWEYPDGILQQPGNPALAAINGKVEYEFIQANRENIATGFGPEVRPVDGLRPVDVQVLDVNVWVRTFTDTELGFPTGVVGAVDISALSTDDALEHFVKARRVDVRI